LARLEVVGKKHGENVTVDRFGEQRIEHGDDRLDAPVQVAAHPIRRTNEDLAVAAVLENVDARVLQEASDDAAHPDVLAHAGDAGTDDAHAANLEIDRDARL